MRLLPPLVLCLATGLAAAPPAPDLRRSELAGPPSDAVVRRDVDGDGRPDMLERWWNGKRVRWLDENGDLRPTDARGDRVADVLQVDMNGDGYYDGVGDQSVKWADNDGDGRADVQAWSTQPPVWGEGGRYSTDESHWMLFLDVEKDGVLGWQDWTTFDFGPSHWAHTGPANWKPDYHGDALFLKIHRPPQALPDPRLNWENPFAFYDTDGDGLTEMAHRWERVEMYYPIHGFGGPEDVDLWSTKRWREGNYARLEMAGAGEKPGLGGHPQADSLGDRGEFDRDGSGGGRLYVGAFDRKLHLAGAEWGAWTVDRAGAFHGGWLAPGGRPSAPGVEEVVRYDDADGNGFLDTVAFDYDGDRTVDFTVSLLDYRTPEDPHPDVVPLVDAHREGWAGLHAALERLARSSWLEALDVYDAAWRRGLTTPEIDALAAPSSLGERHANAHWIKEGVFRLLRQRLAAARAAAPGEAAALTALEKDLTRLYYTGRFPEYVARLAEVPSA